MPTSPFTRDDILQICHLTSLVVCMFSCLMPSVCQSKTALRGNAEAVNIEDANLFLLHRCLLVDHETQSGRWWSACQCQRPDKDMSLPLYKSPPTLPPLLWSEPGTFTSGWTSWQKAICQRLICIQAISSVMWWRLTTPSAYSPGLCSVRRGYMGSMRR